MRAPTPSDISLPPTFSVDLTHLVVLAIAAERSLEGELELGDLVCPRGGSSAALLLRP